MLALLVLSAGCRGKASGSRGAGDSVSASHAAAVDSPTVATTGTIAPECINQKPEGGADTAKVAVAGGDHLLVNDAEYEGWKMFHVYCYRCHGVDALGSDLAPNLRKSVRESVTHDCFVRTVTNGRPWKGMPTWGAGPNPLLDSAQIEDLYQYVKARSDGRLAPGRPHKQGAN